jgi:hypothetical protein
VLCLGSGAFADVPGLHRLYEHAKALFDLVAPQEYGFDAEAKEEIGILTSLPLLRKIVSDLDEAKTTGKSLACFYFTYVSSIFESFLIAAPIGRRATSLRCFIWSWRPDCPSPTLAYPSLTTARKSPSSFTRSTPAAR